jgi:ATP-dependent helicase/nuclease subunit B
VAPANVTLSYSSLDTRQYRESLPSWILLQACRLIEGDAALTYDGLLKHLGEPVSCVPASPGVAVSEAGWWLAGLRRGPLAGREGVLRHFRSAARGVEAAAHRQTDSFTPYDGLVPAAGAALDPVANGISVSASTLQDAATCPYSYFIKRCLRVEPIELPKLDRDAWLDALARGFELHDLYAALMRRCRDEGRRPDVTKDAWILEQAEARLAELCREMPPPSPEVFERERREFVRDVELFLRYESEWTGSEPVGLEVSFGRSYEADGSEPLARPEPVAIPLGNGRRLLLTGRIDRIDRIGPSRYRVIDYKTGRYKAEDWQGTTFAAGTCLQHALYGMAAAELLKRTDPEARVEQGVYLFTSARGGQHPVSIPNPGDAKTAEVLDDLLAVISSGAFVHTSDGDDCRYCDFGPACGPGAPERAAMKLGNAGEAHLESRRRLAAHD